MKTMLLVLPNTIARPPAKPRRYFIILMVIILLFCPLGLLAQNAPAIELSSLGNESCPWLIEVVSELENYLVTIVHADGYRPKIDIRETTVYKLRDDSLKFKILIVLYHPKVDFGSTLIAGFFLLDESSNNVRLLNISEIPKTGFSTEVTPDELFESSH